MSACDRCEHLQKIIVGHEVRLQLKEKALIEAQTRETVCGDCEFFERDNLALRADNERLDRERSELVLRVLELNQELVAEIAKRTHPEQFR